MGRGRRHTISPAQCISGSDVKTKGCSKCFMVPEIIYERFGQSARLLTTTVVRKLRVELDAKDLGDTRVGLFRLICEDMLLENKNWLKEYVTLNGNTSMLVTLPEMYRFLAVMLFSNCTGFSLQRCIPMLQTHSKFVLMIDRLSFFSSKCTGVPSCWT